MTPSRIIEERTREGEGLRAQHASTTPPEKNNMRYLVRIGGKNPGYDVRLAAPGKTPEIVRFSVAAHGTVDRALVAAQEFRDAQYKRLYGATMCSGRHIKHRQATNKSGEIGVFCTTQRYRRMLKSGTKVVEHREYVIAAWCGTKNEVYRRKFSVSKYGLKAAMEMATRCRREAVCRLLGIDLATHHALGLGAAS